MTPFREVSAVDCIQYRPQAMAARAESISDFAWIKEGVVLLLLGLLLLLLQAA